MVKKIKLVEDEKSFEELDTQEFQRQMLEYMKAMDWKLWELLKIEQARAEVNEVTNITNVSDPSVKPIIVDED